MPDPIVSVAQMREIEARSWAAGRIQSEVIRAAGREVARVVVRVTRPGDPVLVLAGHGHNGDDAVEVAAALGDREVRLLRIAEPGALSAACAWLHLHSATPGALVVDGLFGIGLNRPVSGGSAELIAAVNRSRIRVVSVDVPSGLDADTGAVHGTAVEAWITVTLGAVKRGLLVEDAAAYVGRLELARDIGLSGSEDVVGRGDGCWTVAGDFVGFPPRRPVWGHKGTFGHVALVAGSEGYHGAAVLAAMAALRARPGLVTVFTQERSFVPVASQLRAAMVRPWDGEPIEDPTFSAIVIGPGLASPRMDIRCRLEVQRLWRSARCPVVVDASALDWLGGDSTEGAGIRVITPHPGEAGRLLGIDAAAVQRDRFLAVRKLSEAWKQLRVIAVLKGRHTLVSGRDEPVFVNPSGNSGLAQGGSGDVLAGFLGGLLAQPALAADAMQAVRYAVWWHGAAADFLESSGRTWTVDDLVEALGHPHSAGVG